MQHLLPSPIDRNVSFPTRNSGAAITLTSAAAIDTYDRETARGELSMFQPLRIASRSAVLTLLAALLGCVPVSLMAATTASRGDIAVVTVHGTVSATMAGMTVPLAAGAILQLPATVRTGADGAVELRQGQSTFAAAGNTELEIPQSAAEDGLIERIVQIRGNAFYSIGKRTGTRLRVEAPYLVAVIKGTQFNVAAQEDSTTIALFEGHLEVRASDDSDVVDLDAGEIAIRRRNDVTISVLRLNAARGDTRRNPELAARQQADSSNTNAGAVVARSSDPTTTTDNVAGSGVVATAERARVVDAIADTSAPINAKAAIELGSNDSKAVTTTLDAGVSAAGAVSVGTDVTTTVDVGAGSVAAAGDAAVAAGPLSADVGTSAAINVPAGTVDVGVSGAVAATEAVTVDTSVAAAADVPAGTVNVAVDTSVASADVGAAVGVDAGTGNVGADVGVGTVNVGVDVGTSGVGLDVATDSGGGLLGGLGGLLGGGRKRN
jgi:hypothetical protein